MNLTPDHEMLVVFMTGDYSNADRAYKPKDLDYRGFMHFTHVVLKLQYSGRIRSKPWLLMPWVLTADIVVTTRDARYRKTSNIRCTLVGYKIVDHSDVVGASPVSAAPTTSSFST